jgi:hypothetical protein
VFGGHEIGVLSLPDEVVGVQGARVPRPRLGLPVGDDLRVQVRELPDDCRLHAVERRQHGLLVDARRLASGRGSEGHEERERRPARHRCPVPRMIVISRSAGPPGNFSTTPPGHVTSIDSTRAASPSPKCAGATVLVR